jgi:hypothetical protein
MECLKVILPLRAYLDSAPAILGEVFGIGVVTPGLHIAPCAIQWSFGEAVSNVPGFPVASTGDCVASPEYGKEAFLLYAAFTADIDTAMFA